MNKLDKPNTHGMILSSEDKIMSTLFEEKAATKTELKNITNLSYSHIKRVIESMEGKGYVYQREINSSHYYYLSAQGVYEFEYRFNTVTYAEYHDMFILMGYDQENVSRFLRNRFYSYYMTGEWDDETLIDQYLEWCEENQLDPKNHNVKRLKTE